MVLLCEIFSGVTSGWNPPGLSITSLSSNILTKTFMFFNPYERWTHAFTSASYQAANGYSRAGAVQENTIVSKARKIPQLRN